MAMHLMRACCWWMCGISLTKPASAIRRGAGSRNNRRNEYHRASKTADLEISDRVSPAMLPDPSTMNPRCGWIRNTTAKIHRRDGRIEHHAHDDKKRQALAGGRDHLPSVAIRQSHGAPVDFPPCIRD